MYRRIVFASLLAGTPLLLTLPAPADEPRSANKVGRETPADRAEEGGAPDESEQDESEQGDQPPAFALTADVRDVLVPLFSSIANADASRATVEMLSDSLISGAVVDSRKSTLQIASLHPDKFTVYLKEPGQRTRIFCDGKTMAVALAPDAYFRLPEAITNQDAVNGLPVPMGPYSEPVMALTLAGVDPAVSLVGGMQSIEIIDEQDFRGQVPAVHLRGVQADTVTWHFWVSKTNPPKPLRFLVDLTPILLASNQAQVPKGFSHQVRYDFLSWRVTGEIAEHMFAFTPSADATEYKSLEEYYESIAGVGSDSADAPRDKP